MFLTGVLKNAALLNDGRLSGEIYGDLRKRFPDGKYIETSVVVNGTKDGDAITRTGSIYRIESVHPDYEKGYPNALQRLKNRLIVFWQQHEIAKIGKPN